MVFAVLGFSVPIFVIAYILMYVFAIELRWLPAQGYKPLADGFVPFLRSIILPSMALSTLYTALIARISRASVLEVLTEDYIRTARGEGPELAERAHAPRAQECGGAHRDHHRDRDRPSHRWRGRDRERLQHPPVSGVSRWMRSCTGTIR